MKYKLNILDGDYYGYDKSETHSKYDQQGDDIFIYIYPIQSFDSVSTNRNRRVYSKKVYIKSMKNYLRSIRYKKILNWFKNLIPKGGHNT